MHSSCKSLSTENTKSKNNEQKATHFYH